MAPWDCNHISCGEVVVLEVKYKAVERQLQGVWKGKSSMIGKYEGRSKVDNRQGKPRKKVQERLTTRPEQ